MSLTNHKHNTRLKSGSISRKRYIIDDDNNNNSDSDDSDYTSDMDISNNYNLIIEDDDDNNNFNKMEYYKFLNKLFPSSYTKSKINNLKRQRLLGNNFNNTNNILDDYQDNSNNDVKDESVNKVNNLFKIYKNKKLKKIGNLRNRCIYRKCNSENEEDVLSLNYSSDEEDEYEDEEDEYEYDEDEDEDEDEDDDENEYEDEDEEPLFNSKKLKDLLLKSIKKNNNMQNLIIIGNKYGDEELCDDDNSDDDNSDDDNINEEKSNNDENEIISDDNNVKNLETQEEEKKLIPAPKKIATKNYKCFSKILDEEDKEAEYFKNNLSENQQEKYIEQLKSLKQLTSIETPYLIHLMNLDIPDEYKACALRKINMLRSMGCGFGNSEFYKIKSWVDAFIKIPFNKYNNLPITFADGIEQCHDFMENAKKTLDNVAYGLEDAKIQIMQMIGLWLVNPNAVGSAIAIKGPPGTGKTTLIKEGISKILNRPFAMIALGGCGDSGFLDGHDYTYEGSKYGKIIDILIQCGSMNPVILFDELDKLSDSFKGQEITGVLTHLTDTTQNSRFTDKYMSEISLDMSKALYIFSYNDERLVNPILKDRMYKIETQGYKMKDKLIIAKDYLLPKIREQAKYEESDISFNDEILEYIIKDFTEDESGVRNLKRCLEIIHTKLNLYRLMKPDVNLFENSDGFKVKKRISFPCILNKQNIDELLIKGKKDVPPFGMYN